ncbi:MAG: hypothetical protein U0231_13960 [Nitrospiraceae bacterium]
MHPGRGLRWYPLTEGLTTNTLKSGFYWRAPWSDIFVTRHSAEVTREVDALSSDDLLVELKTAIIMRPIAEEVYFLAQEIGPDFLSARRETRVVGCSAERGFQLSDGLGTGEERGNREQSPSGHR